MQAIPAVLAGRDVLAGAQTGTGKTAGFVLPILQRLAADTAHGTSRAPRALVLTPTRELAAQVAQSARDYGKYMQLRTYQVFGGVSINPQISALRSGCDILVATPGRLLDLAQQRAVDLSKVQVLVLDEADRMLDMGFIHDIREHHQIAAAEAPEPAVLRDLFRRHPRRWPSGCCTIRCRSRSRRATRPSNWSNSARIACRRSRSGICWCI